MAATEGERGLGAIALAALALPGVWSAPARAESAPEDGVVSLKFLHYRDRQPGLERITVRSPSLYLLLPIDARWAAEATLVADSVSGATPRWHSAVSGASRMDDERRAGELRVTRYTERAAYAVGVVRSVENDYRSTALSLAARWSSEDNNRTWHLGIGQSDDRIDPVNNLVNGERRRTVELTAGVTQAVSADDLLQFGLTWADGLGYYDDPYKFNDRRPGRRRAGIALLRWNHHVAAAGASLRTSWRVYRDSFGIASHTLQAEWVQPLGEGWALTPIARYYTQRAARFYYDPVYDPLLGEPYPPGYTTHPPRFMSADHRLAAFGAATLGAKLQWQPSRDWAFDLRAAAYQQRADWRVGGSGSPGLAPLRARFLQLGASRRF